MATIYDVAKRAGVSPATVSRVFNGNSASASSNAAVLKAAKELKFTPNRSARSLRRQESEILALVIPDIENPYFTELARGVEDVAHEAGYSVMLCNTDSDTAKESRYLDIAISERMAGVIIACASPRTKLDSVLDSGRQVVTVDRGTDYDVDAVVMDNVLSGRLATQDLVEAGFKRIACITGPRETDTADERARGWEQVMRSSFPDLDLAPLLKYSTFRLADGREAMSELLSMPEPPDAVVTSNNLLGVGAIQVLSEQGQMPPQFGVAVIGTLPFTTLSPSAVTIIRLPVRQMGVTAARMLLERISGDRQAARTVVLRNEVQSAIR